MIEDYLIESSIKGSISGYAVKMRWIKRAATKLYRFKESGMMNVDIAANYYGRRSYTSSALARREKTARPQMGADGPKNSAETTDSLEISSDARQYNQKPTVESILKNAVTPSVSLDDMDDVVSKHENELKDIVSKAKEAADATGEFTILSFMINGEVVTTYMCSMEEGPKSEMTQVADETYVDLDVHPPSISKEEIAKQHASMDKCRDIVDSHNAKDKFQYLSALSAISSLANSNTAFKDLYERDPSFAVSEFTSALGELMEKYRL